MYVLTVELTAQTGQRAALAALLEGMTRTASLEPGVLFYGVNQSRDQRDLFVLCEMYKDEAAFDAHMQLPAIQSALSQFESLLAAAPSIRRCDSLFASPLRSA